MRRFVELIRIYIVSVEFTVALVAIWLHSINPGLFALIGHSFVSTDIKIETLLFVAPVPATVQTYRIGLEILNPDGHKDTLVSWPGYWSLKARVQASLVYSSAGAIGWWCGLMAVIMNHVASGAALAIAGIVINLSTLAAVALAKMELKDIIAGA